MAKKSFLNKIITVGVPILTGIYLIKQIMGDSPVSANEIGPQEQQQIPTRTSQTQPTNDVNSIIKEKVAELNDTVLSDSELEVIVESIIQIESGFRNIVGTDKKSIGYMQLIIPTANWMLNKTNITAEMLLDPKINIEAGLKYFLYQFRRYNQDLDAAISAYHLGTDPYVDDKYYLDKDSTGAYLDKMKLESDRYLNLVMKEITKREI